MDKLKKFFAKVKNYKKQVVIGAVVVAAISAGVVIYNHNSDSGYVTVDLSQIYQINISEGHHYVYEGTWATVNVKDGVSTYDVASNIVMKLNPDASLPTYIQYQKFISDIEFNLNKQENISPGDEIIATASYDKSTAKDLKLKLKNTTLKLTA